MDAGAAPKVYANAGFDMRVERAATVTAGDVTVTVEGVGNAALAVAALKGSALVDPVTPDVVGKVTVVTSSATVGSITFREVPAAGDLPAGKALGTYTYTAGYPCECDRVPRRSEHAEAACEPNPLSCAACCPLQLCSRF
eukprot:142852-Prorocentrum_minimum.AAC.2